jgi:ubiquinone/menaquinone biosynthesis C-methylase UbiE
MTRACADEAAKVMALDLNGVAIERAVKTTPDRLRSKVRFLEGDINQIDLDTKGSDNALLANSL